MKHHRRVSGTFQNFRHSTTVGTDISKGGPSGPWVKKQAPLSPAFLLIVNPYTLAKTVEHGWSTISYDTYYSAVHASGHSHVNEVASVSL